MYMATMTVLICASLANCVAGNALHTFTQTRITLRACLLYQQETNAQHGGVENYLVRAFNYALRPGEVIKVSCTPNQGKIQ
jgi:hypothetical protein